MLTAKEYAELLAVLLRHDSEYDYPNMTDTVEQLKLPLPNKL